MSVCLDALVCVITFDWNAGALFGIESECGGELCPQNIVLVDLS